MRYLLDPKGMNKSIDDVLKLFYDLRNDIPFETSFENHFGIDVETFKEEYYSRMYAYLLGN
jgi:predicted sulfurtransferase